ncbi:MAG: S8/S53 family peptidase [Bradymonadia bacterium]
MQHSRVMLLMITGLLLAGQSAAQNQCIQSATPQEPAPGPCDPSPPSLGIAGEPEAPYSCAEARVLFVDFPLWLPAPSEVPQNPLLGAFQTELDDALTGVVDESWFCAADACGDPCRTAIGNGVDVEVTSVLPFRDVNGRRADGHQRFWRIRFVGQGIAQDPYLPILGPAQCNAVAQVRQIVSQLAPDYGLTAAQAAQVKIGREACNVSPMAGVDRWHLDYMSVAPAQQVPAPPAGDLPQIALIDTGVSNAAIPTVDVVGRYPDPAAAGVNEHGDAMVGFIRQMVPDTAAEIFSWQVMDAEGVGVTAFTGVAIDEAVYGLDPARPLLLNLSLGWLPEYERVRTLRGPGCAIEEDGVGAVVRYMLAVAQEQDTAARPILAVAAAGNRPLNGERAELHKVDENQPLDACTDGWWLGGELTRPPMLFPGEYSRTTVKSDQQQGCVAGEALSFAVGAINARGTPTGVSIPRALAEPRLVAPGAHVFTPQGALAGAPEAYTGTSVSAALTTGALARALAYLGAARSADPLVPRLSGAQLSDLLYLTAYDLNRSTWQGYPVRALNVGAADDLVQCGELLSAIGCLAQGQGPDVIDRCAEWLEVCDAFPGNPPGYDPEGAEPAPQCTANAPGTSDDACVDWTDCTNNDDVRFGPAQIVGEPPDRLRRDALGAVGPQPRVPLCPDCAVLNLFPYLNVSINFSSKYDIATTRFTSPYLLLTDKYGKQAYLPLAVPSNGQGYRPGDSAFFKYLAVPKGIVNIEKAQLVATITQFGKAWAVDTSAMQLK